MDDKSNNNVKVNGIRQVVRLKELVQKWQTVTLGTPPSPRPTPFHGGIPDAICKRLKEVKIADSDEESCPSPDPRHDVPKGYLAVYVGPELRRFIIPTSHLSHTLFKRLLEKAEEEFGFDHNGALTIPCEIETFKFLLKCIETQREDYSKDSSVVVVSQAIEEE